MKKTRLTNIFWLFFEKFGLIILSTISFFTFAIYLTPAQLGYGTLVIVLSELVGSYFNAVFENPLVRRNCEDKSELSSVFWFGGSIGVMGTLFIAALYWYFESDSLIWMMLVFSSISVLASIQARPYIAVLRVKRQFKALAVRTIWGKIAGAICGIFAAIYGAGEWSLIIQLTVMNLVALLILLSKDLSLVLRYPSIKCIVSIAKEGAAIGARKLMSGLFGRGLFIILSITTPATTVGYYSFARRLIDLPKQSILTSINSYSLPVFSKRVNSSAALSHLFTELTITLFIICFPAFLLMGIFGKELILELFAEKWDGAVIFLVLYAAICGVHVITYFTESLLMAFGKSKIGLSREFIKSLVLLGVAYFATTEYGLIGAAAIILLDVLLTIAIRFNAIKSIMDIDNKRLFFNFLRVFLPISSLAAGIAFWLYYYNNYPFVYVVALGVGSSVAFYALLFLFVGNYIKRLMDILNAKH